MTRLSVLCDFDGTISKINVMDFLYQRFAGCGMEYAERWERGEISTQEELRATWATVSAGREALEAALTEVAIDPGLAGLANFCDAEGYPLAIVSEGLEWYIATILARHGIRGIPIYASQIHFTSDGFDFEFPWYHPDTPLRGLCKPRIVRAFQEHGWKVAFIGDGTSDLDVAPVADVIYARDALLAHCRKRGIPATPFESLSDVVDNWRCPT